MTVLAVVLFVVALAAIVLSVLWVAGVSLSSRTRD
jgi:hypothetical protein